MYFETSSKLNKNLFEDSARLRGEGASGRSKRATRGEDNAELELLEKAVSSGDNGADGIGEA